MIILGNTYFFFWTDLLLLATYPDPPSSAPPSPLLPTTAQKDFLDLDALSKKLTYPLFPTAPPPHAKKEKKIFSDFYIHLLQAICPPPPPHTHTHNQFFFRFGFFVKIHFFPTLRFFVKIDIQSNFDSSKCLGLSTFFRTIRISNLPSRLFPYCRKNPSVQNNRVFREKV